MPAVVAVMLRFAARLLNKVLLERWTSEIYCTALHHQSAALFLQNNSRLHLQYCGPGRRIQFSQSAFSVSYSYRLYTKINFYDHKYSALCQK